LFRVQKIKITGEFYRWSAASSLCGDVRYGYLAKAGNRVGFDRRDCANVMFDLLCSRSRRPGGIGGGNRRGTFTLYQHQPAVFAKAFAQAYRESLLHIGDPDGTTQKPHQDVD
jgi:hypothetical protein